MADDKKIGRKQDFPEQDSDRLSIRLPKETITTLELFTVLSPLTRNQVINEAILEYIERIKKEQK